MQKNNELFDILVFIKNNINDKIIRFHIDKNKKLVKKLNKLKKLYKSKKTIKI